MDRSRGRPLKYVDILMALEPHTIYTPSGIVDEALKQDLLPQSQGVDEQTLKLRLRIAMGRLCNAHQFPDEGDGQVRKRGQRPTPGWFGWRWQEVVTKKTKGK